MIESPPTRASLLIRLRDTQDQEAWRQFIEIYSSLIYGFVRGAVSRMPTPRT